MRKVYQIHRATALLAGASLSAMAVPAFAEESEDPSGLEVIVVTAQKREQNLQDVPIAISALSADKIERLAIKDARDLSGLAPNVTVVQGTTSASAAVISIRGISSPAAETFGFDSANALYVDGIYLSRSAAAATDVMDLERVEVLRGPQGTLYGRNSTGGAISFISRKPSKEFRLKAEAGYGNYQAWNGRISIDPGEIAGIATSFSYSHRQRNGTVDNILEANRARDPGAMKSDSFRAAARAELGGTGSFQYIFDYAKTFSATPVFQLTNTSDGAIRAPMTVGGKGVALTQPAPVAGLLASATFAQPACQALAAPTRAYRDTVCNDVSSNSNTESWGHNFQAENDFGAFKVKLTSGYRIWHDSSTSDLDGMGSFTVRGGSASVFNNTLFNGFPSALLQNLGFPAGTSNFLAGSAVPTVTQNLFDTNNVRRHRQFSNELEFSGNTDRLDWVLGGFYFWEKGNENNPQNSGFALDTNVSVFGDAAFANVLRGLGFSATQAATFAPLLAPSFRAANPARYRMVQSRTPLIYTAQAESQALYGQFTFYPGGRESGLRLTAGARYTWDQKKMMRTQNGAAPFVTPQFNTAGFGKFTWNLMLGYDVSDEVSTYARVATGYRSGGFNAGESNTTNQLTPFGAESVTSYEAGLKAELLNRRLRFNLAGYHNVYKDLQLTVPVPTATPGTFASIIGNAGRVTYTGIEAEMQAVLSDNFSIDGSVGYVDIKYKEFLSGQPLVATDPIVDLASIAKPGYTSPLTANIAANARFPLGSGDTVLTARVAYTYEDGKYSFGTNIGSPFNDAIKGDSRSLVDAQIAIEKIPFGGAEGSVRFWGKNITNGHDFVRGVDFGPLGFAGGYFADPATYGVTVGVKF